MGLYRTVPRIIEAWRYDEPGLDEILASALPPGVTFRQATIGAATPQIIIRAEGRKDRTVGPGEPGQWITITTEGFVATMSDQAFADRLEPVT